MVSRLCIGNRQNQNRTQIGGQMNTLNHLVTTTPFFIIELLVIVSIIAFRVWLVR